LKLETHELYLFTSSVCVALSANKTLEVHLDYHLVTAEPLCIWKKIHCMH